MSNNQRKSHVRASCILTVALFSASGLSHGVTVSTVGELENAVASANAGGDKVILLEDGTYNLRDTIYINASGITIAGKSGSRESVIIEGDAMSSNARVGNLIRVAAANFTFRDATLQKSRWHLIQIAGESNADNPVIENCIMRDSYEQMLKVTPDNPDNPTVTSDNGVVEGCLFEYTAGIGPQYYIGGIDAHGAKDWVVRSNIFRNIISPSQAVAEFAVHFWNGSANNLVEQNLIINCDRGIGFGLDGGRPNTGGTIRNNMIYRSVNTGQFADTGIALIESPDSGVYNNTIFMESDFPWAIEYRFSTTQRVFISNNLTNKAIVQRDGASGAATSNVTDATRSWFVNPSAGDLHLSAFIDPVVDSGRTIAALISDFDGDSRPQGAGIDIGADEYTTFAGLQPPRNLRVVGP